MRSRRSKFFLCFCASAALNRADVERDSNRVFVIDHPLAATKLSILRAKTTVAEDFRRNVQELATLLLAEAARAWATTPIEVETPLRKCAGEILTRPIVLVPILRAGLGLLDGMLRLVPDANVGHIGIYRDEKTLRAVSYFSRLPSNLQEAEVVLIDPMLATGGSAREAVSLLKTHGAQRIQFICLVGCPPGIAQLHSAHPEVRILTAAIDPELNEFGYIVPGLGDAGDRYFGTV
jgi:uracil phosphoribosyltransferase